MFKRFLWVMAALTMVVSLGVPAMAGEETGSIQVTLRVGREPAQGGSVTLYRVGVPAGGDYDLTPDFGSGIIRGEDALSPVLAAWLAETAGTAGVGKVLDGEGSASFFGLQEGLYLLVQTEASPGFVPMEPMLVMVPCEFQWNVQAFPKIEIRENPATGQSPLPFLGVAGMLLSSAGLALCGRKRKKYKTVLSS